MSRSRSKLSVASAVGEIEFNLSETAWSRVEKAYARSLSKKAKFQITKSTITFLEFEKLERNAEPLAWTEEKIEKIKEAAAKLSGELRRCAKGDDTLLNAKYHINANWCSRSNHKFSDLDELLFQLSVACCRAIEEVGETPESGFREGEAWDEWIRALTKIIERYNLPSAASKGSDKSVGRVSPFVVLVHELQRCLLGGRRHTHSRGALAQAISRARATGRKSSSKSQK